MNLDKLAQLRTEFNHPNTKEVEIINGVGACKESIKKRPRRKFIDQSTCLAMINYAKEIGDEEYVQPYWNTYHCQGNLITYNGRAYGNYCKNRWCTICQSIRKANMINLYKPVIDVWKDPHLLTLTVKAQPKTNLKYWIGGMIKALQRIQDKHRKRFKRGKGIKLIGIRSLECNFNPIKKTYNPHFHIITASKEIALIIKKDWIDIWNKKYVKTKDKKYYFTAPFCQDIRPIKSTEKDLIECIKYGAKIFTDPTMKKGKNKSVTPIIYASALHEIYKALRGRRLFSSFGFCLPDMQGESPGSRVISDFQKWSYRQEVLDWVNDETGQIMTNFIPDNELTEILKNLNVILK